MAVTVTTNTLSTRVRYLNVSASTANADAKDVVLAMANALIDLGWSRYDTAGATAVVGTDDNAGVILRRACYDFAQSGHYNYLGLRLVGSGTNTYTFFLTQAADWSNAASMTAFVGGATNTVYTPNTTGRTTLLDFTQGGTIWLFDSDRTLVITSQSGATLTKGIDSTWVVGEYKKEFGENVNAATGYIHNGVFTNSRWLMDGNGAGSSNSFPGHTLVSGVALASASSAGILSSATFPTSTSEQQVNFPSANRHDNWRFIGGIGYSQFALTESPAVSAAASALSRAAVAPTAGGNSFTTRLLMGYYGYVGHLSLFAAFSINYLMRGSANDITTGSTTLTNPTSYAGTLNSPMLFCAQGTTYTLLNSMQEYAPNTLPTALRFNVFEPTLSCGTNNGLAPSFTAPNNTTTYTYSGPQYKFSMLGRIFDFKIFGPYTSEKYVFLDSISMPCDADGFYQEGGTDKDFWIIPVSNFTAFVMPK
jgi:hypothetical protein